MAEVQRAHVPGSERSVWLVVGDDFLPIGPVRLFLDYLDDLERSPNTVRAYAYHLKLFWDYLQAHELDWREVGLGELAGFVAWLRRGSSRIVSLEEQQARRSESTINAILSAVYAFREFHRRTGELPAGSSDSEVGWTFPTTRPYKPFLHHISKAKPVRTRLVKLKQPRLLPRTLQPAQVHELVQACHHLRDQLLVCLVYEAGLRIGQALGLRHEDVRSWDNQVAIVPRDNVNGARTKRRDVLVVDVDPAVMTVYARYLIDEVGELDTDYVFVNLWEGEIGRPLTYSAVLDLFRRLERRTGIYARPHMLRHSHATDLIRTGHWDLSYVQRRLRPRQHPDDREVPAPGRRRSQSRASGLSTTTARTGRTHPMNDAHGDVAVGEGCSFIPDLDEFWAADTWQLWNGETLPGLAAVREGGALHWQGLTPSLTAELKWACAHKFISHEWTLARWRSQLALLRSIITWLAADAPDTVCLFDRDLAHCVAPLRTHLLASGRYRPQRGRYWRRDGGTVETVSCLHNDPVVTAFNVLYRVLDEAHDHRDLFAKDVWSAREIGIHTSGTNGTQRVIFTGIRQRWLKDAAKRVAQVRLSSHSLADAAALTMALKHFSRYLDKFHPGITGDGIDRTLVLGFLHALQSEGLSAGTRAGTTTYLRAFLETCGRERWGGIADRPLIYRDDYPRLGAAVPRYLPSEVLSQLEAHLHKLPDTLQRMTRILTECGMRISELCSMPIDCLLRDDDGDYFLRYYQGKQRKEHVVPISHEVAAIVQEQQATVRAQQGEAAAHWLFPGHAGRPLTRQTLPAALNRLAAGCGIFGPDGQPVWFEAHQFRHTVGTSLINNGVPQHLVQRFLGHESPEMTNTYAHIFDSTLKRALEDYRTKKVDITGALVESFGDPVPDDARLLKRTVLAQALPNGHCHLPVRAGPCPHANACLTCTHFRSSERFLPILKQQLAETERILEWARDNSAIRQIEMNERVRSNLRNMIGALEGGASLADIAERLDGRASTQADTAQLIMLDTPSARV